MYNAGVDESMVVTLKFSQDRLAVCTCTIAVELPSEAVIFGTKGTIRVSARDGCGLANVNYAGPNHIATLS